MISQITESKDTKTPPSLGIRGTERCNPRNEKYAWGRHNRRTSVPITPFTWHSLLWLYHKTTQFAIFSFLTLSLSAGSPCPGRRKHKFSTGVWKTVLQNTNRPCGVDSHGRFAFPGALMDQVSQRRHAHRRFSISRQLWVVRQLLSRSLCRFSHSRYGSVRERQSLRAARR